MSAPRLGDLGGDITLIFVIWVSQRGLWVGAKARIPQEKIRLSLALLLTLSISFKHFILVLYYACYHVYHGSCLCLE